MGNGCILSQNKSKNNQSYIISINSDLTLKKIKAYEFYYCSQNNDNYILDFETQEDYDEEIESEGSSIEDELDEIFMSKDYNWENQLQLSQKWETIRQFSHTLTQIQKSTDTKEQDKYDYNKRLCTREIQDQQIGQYFLERKENAQNIKNWEKMIQYGDKKRYLMENGKQISDPKIQMEEKMQYQSPQKKLWRFCIAPKKSSSKKQKPQLSSGKNSTANSASPQKQKSFEKQGPVSLQMFEEQQIKDNIQQQQKQQENKNSPKGEYIRYDKSQSIEKTLNLNQAEIERDLTLYKKKYNKAFRNSIKKGPPMQFRWPAWKVQILGQGISNDKSALYEQILGSFDNNTSDKQIQKDLHRTFPSEKYFNFPENMNNSQNGNLDKENTPSHGFYKVEHVPIQTDVLGQQQLFRVLRASSIYFKKVGYCQGMNFIGAFLLLISGGNEVEAFTAFISILENYHFLSMFEMGFPLYSVLQNIFSITFKNKLPKLYNFLEQNNMDQMTYLFKWFETLFLCSFPFEICVRIWDYILVKGVLSTVDVAIAILSSLEDYLMKLDDVEISQFLQKDTNQITCIPYKEYTQLENQPPNIDPDRLIGTARKIKLTYREKMQLMGDFLQQNPEIQKDFHIQQLYQAIKSKAFRFKIWEKKKKQ